MTASTKIAYGGRRTRRVNAWAKAAGEYYRSHKNDPDIQDFSDVLKSPKFKAYYQSKYGKNTSRPSFNSTRRGSRGSFNKSRRFNKKNNRMDNRMDNRMEEDENMEEKEEEEKPMNRKGKNTQEASDDWSWGWDSKKKGLNEEMEPEKKKGFFNRGGKTHPTSNM